MDKLVVRPMLQVDACVEIKQMLKQIALKENKSIRAVVLTALADKYPQLQPLIRAELGEQFPE